GEARELRSTRRSCSSERRDTLSREPAAREGAVMVKHAHEEAAKEETLAPEEQVGGPEQLAISLSPDPNLGGLRQGDRFIKGMGFKVLGLRVRPAECTATGVSVATTLAQIGWKNHNCVARR